MSCPGPTECPFVVAKDGLYYLFRNQRYGEDQLNTQYCSPNMLDFGVDAGVLRRSGTWLSYGETRLGQGRERAREFLKENPDMAKEIEAKLMTAIAERAAAPRGKGGAVSAGQKAAGAQKAAAARSDSVQHVFFVDSVFNLPAPHAKQICRTLIDRNVGLPWTCYANPLGFDAELAELMARSRCAGLEIGSDSGCDEILAKLRKGFDTGALLRAHALL